MKHDPPESQTRAAWGRTALLLSIILANTLLFAFVGWILGGMTAALIVGAIAFVLSGAAFGMVANSARHRR
jgi:ABC-type multidrug transport system permease subunit